MSFLESTAGGRLCYHQQGSGRPLLFVHGWCMSGQVWQRQQVLADQYRVLTFDLRGHGYSTVPTGGMGGFAGYAADLVDLMEALDLQDTVLVGWSLGAQVLLKAYAAIAARVAGIVLVGATPRFTAAPYFPFGLPPKEAEGMRLKIRRNLERTLDGFHRQLFVAGELANPQLQETVQAILAGVPVPSTAAALDGLEALMTAEMQHEAASVSCPALLLHGDQDPICLPQASAWLAEQMPASRRLLYHGCGHAPFLSRADQFNHDLRQFVEGLDARH
jgi:pimeloyl-[acyl-carrier protein] methyl ester esterase